MTETPIVPFPASPYCQVRARVASIWADGPDDGTHPDWRPAVGEKITLTPSIGSQLLTYDVGGPEPIIVTVERVDCVVGSDGFLTKSDGRPVYIAPTDDPLLSATGWTWTASIKGKSVVFAAPTGGVVDLAMFIAAPATNYTKAWVERIPELITAGANAVDAAAVAVEARDTATGAASAATGAASTATAARDDAAAYASGMNVQVGGRNLILNSAPNWTISDYQMGILQLGSNPPLHGEQVTISIKGELGADRTSFAFYNSGGTVLAVFSLDGLSKPVYATQDARGEDGVFRVTGYWQVLRGDTTAVNTHLRIFQAPGSASSDSTIEWIKLERGNRATDWTPAPEDIGVNPDTAQWAAPHSLALELADAAARTIVGPGRPDIHATLTPDVAALVAAASSGAEFRSIDGPQGAWVWRKRGSTWAISDGYTGWRTYGVSEIQTVQPSINGATLLREEGTVTLRLNGVSVLSPMTTLPGWIPAGFRPSYPAWMGHAPNAGGSGYWRSALKLQETLP